MKMTIIYFCFAILMMVEVVSSSKFDELFQPSWALDHFTYEGELLKLKLDNFSGTIFNNPFFQLKKYSLKKFFWL